MKVYSAVLESLASEFTARRNAMKQATDAADDMIGALKRQYNKTEKTIADKGRTDKASIKEMEKLGELFKFFKFI